MKNPHYLIQIRRADGSELVGLHTDDLAQALRRAERLWQTGLYGAVAVAECRWDAGRACWLPGGPRLRLWGGAARAA